MYVCLHDESRLESGPSITPGILWQQKQLSTVLEKKEKAAAAGGGAELRVQRESLGNGRMDA